MRVKHAEKASGVESLVDQLKGKTKHPGIGLGYRLSLLLAAIGMIILPLIYVAMIAGVGWFTYLHTVNGIAIFKHTGGWMSLVMYAGPIVIGAISILFMIKPLFARPGKGGEDYEISRTSDPALFSYLDALCANLGAPAPRRVVIDTQVNASAGFTKGMFGWLTNHLTLTIGTPLISGLSQEQLTGVLAHEFGHFSQGGGMRLSYIIRTINLWFLRVVYERDSMDEWLDQAKKQVDLRIGIVLAIAGFCVWLSRRILWVLMRAGDLISCYLLRQMEFDADLNQILIVGSDTFERSSLRFMELCFGEQEARTALSASFQEGRMSADYGGMVANCANKLPPEVTKQIRENIEQEKTELLATHPCTIERIQRAKTVGAAGIICSQASSEALFEGYPAIAVQVTTSLYANVFGDAMKSIEIQPNQEIIGRMEKESADFSGLETFFNNQVTFRRPISIPNIPSESPELEILHKERESWKAKTPDYEETFSQYNQLVERDGTLLQIDELYNCHLNWKEKTIGFPMIEPDQVEAMQKEDRKAIQELEEKMSIWEERCGEHLAHSLARVKEAASASMEAGIEAHLEILRGIVKMAPRLRVMYNHMIRLNTIFTAHNEKLSSPQLGQHAQRLASQLRKDLESVQRKLAKLTYPFDHARGVVTLAQVYLPEIPKEEDIGSVYEIAESVYGDVSRLYYRLLGRLGRVAHGALEVQDDKAHTATSSG